MMTINIDTKKRDTDKQEKIKLETHRPIQRQKEIERKKDQKI